MYRECVHHYLRAIFDEAALSLDFGAQQNYFRSILWKNREAIYQNKVINVLNNVVESHLLIIINKTNCILN